MRSGWNHAVGATMGATMGESVRDTVGCTVGGTLAGMRSGWNHAMASRTTLASIDRSSTLSAHVVATLRCSRSELSARDLAA